MPRIGVVTDSGADLSEPMAHMYSIREVPVTVRAGDTVFADDAWTSGQFWSVAHHYTTHPRVSGPSPLMFYRAFATLLERSDHILCLTSSEKLGKAYQSACTASQQFGNSVTVLDTHSLSLAQAYHAVAAAEAIAAGLPLPEIIRLVLSIRDRTHMLICPDTTRHIRTGRRVDRILRAIEPILQSSRMKALLRVKNGQLTIVGTALSRAHGVRRVRREIVRRGPAEMLTVTHTRLPGPARDLAHDLARALDFPVKDVLVAEAGPVLYTLFGRGAIAASIVQRSR